MKKPLVSVILLTGFAIFDLAAQQSTRNVKAVDPAEFSFTVKVSLKDMSPELKKAKVNCGVGRQSITMGTLDGVKGFKKASSATASISKDGSLKKTFRISLQLDAQQQIKYQQDAKAHNYECKLYVSENGKDWKPLIVKPNDHSRNNYVKSGTQPNIPKLANMPHVFKVSSIPH